MTVKLPDIGKISPEIFQHLILPHLGARDARVLVPPQNGVDVGVISIGGGQVMAVTTDPIFIVPAYGWERAAWFALHILASDAATSGLRPTYLTIDLNLPLSLDMEGLDAIWTTIHRECERLGIAIVAGHTARYDGCDYPMVGGATVMSVGPEDSYIVPTMAQVGDAVIVTKGAAIEATGLFGVSFPALVEEKCGAAVAQGAADLFWQMSVVEDAMAAVSVGVRGNGVTAMHDATECGVWGDSMRSRRRRASACASTARRSLSRTRPAPSARPSRWTHTRRSAREHSCLPAAQRRRTPSSVRWQRSRSLAASLARHSPPTGA